MSKKTNIIKINGKQYDVFSGQRIDSYLPKVSSVILESEHPKTISSNGDNLASTIKTKAKLSKSNLSSSRKIKPIKRHQPQNSKTLMRKLVQKPSIKTSKRLKSNSSIIHKSSVSPSLNKIEHKNSINHINPRRSQLSQEVSRSNAISRFSHFEQGTSLSTPINSSPSTNRYSVAYIPQNHQKSVSTKQKEPSLDIFEQALARATSHKELLHELPSDIKKKHFRSRLHLTAGIVGAILVIGSFMTLHNLPHINLETASAKSGFKANLPSYQPAGFSVENFNSAPGSVALNYISNSDDRNFKITEQASQWNNSALFSNFVSKLPSKDYQIYSVPGRTVYTYDTNKATWVDKGVWYQVTNRGALSDKQLVELANSL